MIARTVLNSLVRNRKFVKFSSCQRILNIHTTALLQSQDVQNDDIVSTPSVFSFDSTLAKTPQKRTDILETKLVKAKSSDEILQLAATHSSIMNNKHISTAFSLLHGFIKHKSRNELRDITHDHDFLQLCKRVLQTAHHLTPDEAITVFKTLGFLNVPSTSNVMQVLCQILRRNVNSLPLNQIVFLVYLLGKQQPTPLVEALLIALPLVLQSQLDLQMDPENMNEMVYCLEVSTTRKLNNAVIQKLSDALLLNADKLTVYQARIIIASLVPGRQFPDSFEQLVFKSLELVALDINAMTDKEAMMVLSKLTKTNFFNRSFLTAVIEKAIVGKWDLVKLNQLLAVCEKHEFISEDLLDYTVCEMQQHCDELANDNRISLINIIDCFGLVGYDSGTSKEMWTVVANCKKKLEALQKKSPLLFFKLNTQLSILGCSPLSSFFEDDVLSCISENIKKGKIHFAQELCIIEWATKLADSNESGLYLPEHLFQDAINGIWEMRQKRNFFLEPFLKVALGGAQFYETNLMTKYGHSIDHVVVLRKGDYPIAIERTSSVSNENPQPIRFVEDLTTPPESKILVIITAGRYGYCKNSSHLKGWMKLQLRTLSRLGYLPLMIKSDSWEGLLSHEKIPYLMREMKEVLKHSEQEDSVNAYPAM